MANETANVFIELRDRETRDNSQGRYKILVRKLDEVDREARRVDEKIAAFLREAMVFGPEAVQEQIKALAELKRGRDEAAAATEAAEQSAQDLQKQLKTEGKMQYVKLRQVDPSLQSLQEKADELEIQYIKAQAEYQPSADELESLKEQLETARQQVEQARRKRFVEVTQAAPNPEYQELLKASLEAQARTALSRARSQRFNQAYDEEMRALSKLPGQFQKLSDLRRQAEEFARLRGLLLSKKLDAEIEMNTLQKKAAIGDRALTGKAVAPRKPQLVIAVIVLSLAVGIGAALASHWTDVTVNAPEEMERVTGVPSLGFIPDMGRRDGAQQLVAHHSPRSPVSEAYRTLRSTLRYATMDKPIRTLIVTSAAAGEGKTVTAANLAVSIADTGQRVMVVDADLRRPSQHGLFEKERTVGLTSVLVGDLELSAALLRTDVENLTLLPAGPTPPNPSELLESAAMTETLEQLAAMCDLVIIDVPPVLAVTDACALTSKVDAVLLVVRAGKTPSDVTAQAVGTLQRARGSVVGAVLNGVKVTRNSLYHYYYAYADGTRRQRVSQRGR
jgi:tyrosine-protein kinase Etk/Wzc